MHKASKQKIYKVTTVLVSVIDHEAIVDIYDIFPIIFFYIFPLFSGKISADWGSLLDGMM